MYARLISSLGALVLLSACASETGGGVAPRAAEPARQMSEFRASDFAWSRAPGRGAIQGQVTYRVAGAAYSCASAPVVLTPETPWVRARMMILYRSDQAAAEPAEDVRGRTPPERSQDYSAFIRRTTCDAGSHFSFSGLPDGSWFVITVARPPAGVAGREMALMRRLTIRGGQTVNVRL